MVRQGLIVVLGVVVGGVGVVGCSSTLETGYEPRKLNATNEERRAYYAPAYSPQSQVAKPDREDELNMRRPRPGY